MLAMFICLQIFASGFNFIMLGEFTTDYFESEFRKLNVIEIFHFKKRLNYFLN